MGGFCVVVLAVAAEDVALDCSPFHATPLVPAMGLDEDGKMRMKRRPMGRLKAPHTCQNYADEDDDDDDDDDGHAGALPVHAARFLCAAGVEIFCCIAVIVMMMVI